MEAFGTIFAVLQEIRSHCDNVRLRGEVYGRLRSLVDLFVPLLREYAAALDDAGGGGGGGGAAPPPWVPALESALSGALRALDECARRPIRARLFPAHHVGTLRAARESVRDAVDAIAVYNAGAAVRTRGAIDALGGRLDALQGEGEAFVRDLAAALRSGGGAAASDAVARRHGVDPRSMEALRLGLAGEESHCVARLRSVKDAAERREVELAIELSRLAAGATERCPDDFRCPITLELMADPALLVQSGHTYERKAAQIALVHRPNVDPKTNARFEGEAVLVPNHSLRGSIEQWKSEMSAGWSGWAGGTERSEWSPEISSDVSGTADDGASGAAQPRTTSASSGGEADEAELMATIRASLSSSDGEDDDAHLMAAIRASLETDAAGGVRAGGSGQPPAPTTLASASAAPPPCAIASSSDGEHNDVYRMAAIRASLETGAAGGVRAGGSGQVPVPPLTGVSAAPPCAIASSSDGGDDDSYPVAAIRASLETDAAGGVGAGGSGQLSVPPLTGVSAAPETDDESSTDPGRCALS